MSDAELKSAETVPCADNRRNFFDEFEQEEPLADPRTRLLHMLSDTGDVLEEIEERCSNLVLAIENSSLTAGDAARLKKRVWRIEDLSVKAAEKINGRHDDAPL